MPLDENDIAKIAELIATNNTTLQAALDEKFVTADATAKIVKQSLEGLNLADQITTAVTKAAEGIRKPGEGDEGGGSGKGGQNNGETGNQTPKEVLKMQERLDQMERQAREAEEARGAAESREKENNLTGTIRDALGGAGFPANRHAQVIPYLRTITTDAGKPVIGFNAEGKLTWLQQEKGYIDTLTVADGVKVWASTDAGKLYMPPSGQQGAGGSSGEAPRNKARGNAPRKTDGTVDWGALGGKPLNITGTIGAAG